MFSLSRARLQFRSSAAMLAARLIRPGLAANLFSLGAAASISRVMTFITMAYAARVLGKANFGLLSFGTAVAAYAAILVGPGLLVWGTRAISHDHQKAGKYLAIINLMQMLMAGLSYLGLVLIANTYFKSSEREIALVAGLGVFAIAASVDWVSQGLERFQLIGAVQILTSILTLLLTYLLVRSPIHVFRIPVIAAGTQFLGALVLFSLLYGRGLLSFAEVEWRQAGAILRAALPLGLSGAVMALLHYSCHIVLWYYRGKETLGLFAAAFRLLDMLPMVSSLVSNVFLPRLSRTYISNPVETKSGMRMYFRIVMSIGFLPAIFFAIEAPTLIQLSFGPQYAAAADVLRVMGFAVLFNFAAIVYITGLLVMGRDRVYLWSIFAALACTVVGALLSVPVWGIWGATITVSCADFITWLVTLSTYRRLMGTMFLEEWIRPFFAGALTAVCLAGGIRLGAPFWLRIVTGILIYGVMIVPPGILRAYLRSGEMVCQD